MASRKLQDEWRGAFARQAQSDKRTYELLSRYDDEGRPIVRPGRFVISVGGGQDDDPAAGAVSAELAVR